MQKTIDFTRETYNWLKELSTTTEKWNDEWLDDDLGFIKQGAVCCDLTLMIDPGFKDESYAFNGRFVIDAKYFLLGKDTGYGEIKGVPYDCVSGFYGYLKDTYEDTLNGLSEQFAECLKEDAELVAGVENTELTWEKVESYPGDIYPGYQAM